jgi:alkaline phosphatase D
MINRRRVVTALAAAGATWASSASRTQVAARSLADYPFKLGVASGFPTHQSVVLWTMLAPQPLAPGRGMPPGNHVVHWQMAIDETFRRIVASGTVAATSMYSHSARDEVQGLTPARDYWYRFMHGKHRSPVGRARTLPAPGQPLTDLRVAVANCQQFEHGHYAAYAHIAAAAPDLVLHIGDYIYEGAPTNGRIRMHVGALCRSLDDYRLRYSQYQMDPSLQAAHAASSWLCTWDDHEVANDYAGITTGRDEATDVFLARRTAAYQAYFEHLPLPPSAAPRGSDMPIFTRRGVGDLASIHMLDQRQYRSPEACAKPARAGDNRVDESCTERQLPDRTMLGLRQENWLRDGLINHKAPWTLIAQGTVVSHLDEKSGAGSVYGTDAWNGYPAARQRLLQSLKQTGTTNPVILSGDLHAFMVGGVNEIPEQLESPLVASEFVATSITSDSRPQAQLDQWRAENPNLLLAAGEHRGYLALHIQRERLQVDLVAIDNRDDPNSGKHVLKSFVIEAGSPRIHSV